MQTQIVHWKGQAIGMTLCGFDYRVPGLVTYTTDIPADVTCEACRAVVAEIEAHNAEADRLQLVRERKATGGAS